MIVRTIGIVLLGTAFALLAIALSLYDPTALDANIGMGVLTIVGIPLGALGLAMTVVGSALERRRRR